MLLNGKPWTQFFDLKNQPSPKSIVRNVTLLDVKGLVGSLGTLQNINVTVKNETFKAVDVKNLKIENVTVTGKRF